MPQSYKLYYWHEEIGERHKYQRIVGTEKKAKLPIVLRLGKSIHFAIGNFEKPNPKLLRDTKKNWQKFEKQLSPDICNVIPGTPYFKDDVR